jgi:putative ABC transport system ATP-binding protein
MAWARFSRPGRGTGGATDDTTGTGTNGTGTPGGAGNPAGAGAGGFRQAAAPAFAAPPGPWDPARTAPGPWDPARTAPGPDSGGPGGPTAATGPAAAGGRHRTAAPTGPAGTEPAPALRLEAVTKTYGSGSTAVTALREVTFGVPRGSFTAVMGPSGSGKSTFLHCLAGLDRPTSGRVHLGDTDVTGLKEAALTAVRRERIGYVFQAYNLMAALTVRQNVTLVPRLIGRPVHEDRLREVADRVGIGGLLDRRPHQLSGGQQQRVAIARALVTRPEAVLADEPTGALDSRTGREVLSLFRQLVDTTGQTVLMVTHDPVAASHADSVVFLADGRLAGRLFRPSAEEVADRMTRLGDR